MLPKPKKTKFLKVHKGKLSCHVSAVNAIFFKSGHGFALYVKENGFLIDKHLDMGKKLLKSIIAKKGQVLMHVFPQKPITKKPTGVRLGKGKGPVDSWVIAVTAGQTVFEIKNTIKTVAIKALTAVKKKMPLQIEVRRVNQPLPLLKMCGMLYYK